MARQEILERLADSHEAQIKKTLENLEADIISGISKATNDDNILTTKISIDLRKDLKQYMEQYRIDTDTLVRDYDQIVNSFMEEFGQLNIPDKFKSLTEVDLLTINQLKFQSFSGFEEIANRYLTEISANVYQNAIVGKPFNEMVKDIRGLITGDVDRRGRSMSTYASQIAHDSVMQFDGQFTVFKAKEAGLDKYKYTGTLVRDSRDHCRLHIGKTYTEDRIREIWQGSWAGKSEGDPFIVRGGYRCRHTWIPVVEVEEDVIPEEVIEPTSTSRSNVKDVVISSLLNRGSTKTRQAYDDDFNSQLTDQQKIIVDKFDKPTVIKNGKKGYYQAGNGELSAELNAIDQSDDAVKGVKSYVISHEYGHHIDYITNKSTRKAWSETNKDFMEAIEKDKKRFKGNTYRDLSGRNLSGYHVIDNEEYQVLFDKIATRKKIERFSKNNPNILIGVRHSTELKGDGYGNISDIIDALSKGTFRKQYRTWGHSEKYWKKLGNVEVEIFANLFSLQHNKKAYALVKEIIPNTVKEFEKRMKVLESL
ncbi:hypothetical protein [uncultured Mediterranean phage uvMED]|nr:hypothetical protein [uncultured Mediterranean phage uvMED]